MKTAVIREVAIAVLFALLAVLMTWPLARNLTSAVSDPGDPFLNIWILHWDYVGTFHDPTPLFDAKIYHPAKHALAFSENLYGVAIFLFPFYAAGVQPITAYNIAFLLGFALSGYGGYVLARTVTRSTAAGIVAGIFFAFVPFRFDHLPHIQHVWSPWLPLMLAALIHFARRPSIARSALVGGACLLNGLSNIHWLVFGATALGFAALLFMAADARLRAPRFWLALGGAVLVAGLLLLPFLLPYRRAAEAYGFKRSRGEVQHYSAVLGDWLVPSVRNKTYGTLPIAKEGEGERMLFPGLGVLLLAGWGLFATRRSDFDDDRAVTASDRDASPRLLRMLDILIVLGLVTGYYAAATGKIRWTIGDINILRASNAGAPLFIAMILALVRLWFRFPDAWGGASGRSLRTIIAESRFPASVWAAILWVFAGVLGSLGLNGFFHRFLFSTFDIYRSIRVPARWAMIAYVGLTVLAACGVVALLRNRSPRLRGAIAAILSIAMLAELRAAPIRWHLTNPEPPAVYRWLADAPISGAVLELPMDRAYTYMLRATAHHKPLINGFSGFEPKLHADLVQMTTADRIDHRLYSRLQRIGCSIIVVHNDALTTPDPIRHWIRDEVSRGRLTFLRKFDQSLGGDWVFALTANEKNTSKLRAPSSIDRAGRTPEENLALFFENRPAYVEGTFGVLDFPRHGDEVRGALALSGWALSSSKVRSVNLLFENGRVSIPAERFEAPRVREIFPWYENSGPPGFRKMLLQRPKGVSIDTDLQVEIVEESGRRVRLDQIEFRWLPGLKIESSQWRPEALKALLVRMRYEPESASRLVLSGEKTIQQLADEKLRALDPIDNGEFVRLAYRTILDREADPEGYDFQNRQLLSGKTRLEILEALLKSEEFAEKHLK